MDLQFPSPDPKLACMQTQFVNDWKSFDAL